MSRPIATLTRIVKNPYLNVVVGLVFLYTGISETVHELDQLEDGTIAAHHGVILFSIMHVLKTLPECFEGLESLDRAGKEE